MVHWSTHFSLEHYYNHYEYTRLSSELTVEEISIYYTFEFLRDVCLLENNDPEAQFEYRTLYDIFDPDRKIRTAWQHIESAYAEWKNDESWSVQPKNTGKSLLH